MDLTPQQTQVQGVNGTMDFITSAGCKSDHGFDPTTDKSIGLNGSMSLTPQQTKVQGCKWDHAFDPTTDKSTRV